jgi:hypothetical protein
MGRGIGVRAWDIIYKINPWNVSEERMNEREQEFGQMVNAVSHPKETVKNIRQELKQTGRKLMSSDPNEVGDGMAGVVVTTVSLYSMYKSVSSLVRSVSSAGRVMFKNVQS